MKANYDQLAKLINSTNDIVIVQADNPDGDSLGSALALEQILHEMGKNPSLLCGVNIPGYLHYMQGWDRVERELPKQFDLSIFVDSSRLVLFDSLVRSKQINRLSKKPAIIIDHHPDDVTIDFASASAIEPAVATSEVIYEIAHSLNWKLNQTAKEMLVYSILSDSLGLMSEGTSVRSIRIVADLVEQGVKLAKLDSERRKFMRKSLELTKYKGDLLKRVQVQGDGKVALVTIPWVEIEKYSPDYNPSMLVIDDMRLIEGVDVAVAFKVYSGGKITAKIRCNYGKGIAHDLAEHFGGGGHPYASGFKIEDAQSRSISNVQTETVKVAVSLLNDLNKK
ncbi:MAG TPA: DHH family phosphoesterase [Candidatus Saccharimonadales bacterium]|nr:DHH family phosphoesterase [Candidatus Saccharimonadales bacterium]